MNTARKVLLIQVSFPETQKALVAQDEIKQDADLIYIQQQPTAFDADSASVEERTSRAHFAEETREDSSDECCSAWLKPIKGQMKSCIMA